MERLVREVGAAVAERVVGGQESVDDVARELHEKLLLRNESTKQLFVEDIYVSLLLIRGSNIIHAVLSPADMLDDHLSLKLHPKA